jgi:hypothetical protein
MSRPPISLKLVARSRDLFAIVLVNKKGLLSKSSLIERHTSNLFRQCDSLAHRVSLLQNRPIN